MPCELLSFSHLNWFGKAKMLATGCICGSKNLDGSMWQPGKNNRLCSRKNHADVPTNPDYVATINKHQAIHAEVSS